MVGGSVLDEPESVTGVPLRDAALDAGGPPLLLAEVREPVAVRLAHACLDGGLGGPLPPCLQDGLAHASQHDVGGRLRVGRDAAAHGALARLPLAPEAQQTRPADAVRAGQQHGVLEHVAANRAEKVLLGQ